MRLVYLTNHSRSLVPVKSKVSEDASVKLMNQLLIQQRSILLLIKIRIHVCLPVFCFSQEVISQLTKTRNFLWIFKSYLSSCKNYSIHTHTPKKTHCSCLCFCKHTQHITSSLIIKEKTQLLQKHWKFQYSFLLFTQRRKSCTEYRSPLVTLTSGHYDSLSCLQVTA